jgi:hypothetical protein
MLASEPPLGSSREPVGRSMDAAALKGRSVRL